MSPVVSDRRDNVVSYPDQALLLARPEQDAAIQLCWHYHHPVSLERIRQFHADFGHGLMGRRVERSPLPFGRHRWVASPGPQADLDVAENHRPPNELFDFADEQLELPLDPESGPAWRLAVQPFTDGSTAVLLTVSHCLVDGTGVFVSLHEAMSGNLRDLGYPEAGSRSRLRALRSDLTQTMRDGPEVGRTLVKAVRAAVSRRRQLVAPDPTKRPFGADGGSHLRVPSAAVIVEAGEWDSRAESMGGTSLSMVAGFAVKLAGRIGRTRADNSEVTLMIPVSERDDLGHSGGNVVSIARAYVDTTAIAEDLSRARTEIRKAIRKAREAPDEMFELLPLIPFVPKRAFHRLIDMTFGLSADAPVSCTNMGDVPSELLRIDGTEAEFYWVRGMDRHLTREALERRNGLLTVTSGRIAGKVCMGVVSYQPGVENSHAGLRSVIAAALNDFQLTGVIR